MKKILIAIIVIFISLGWFFFAPVQAQDSTETEIVFANELEEKTRNQLRRLSTTYNLEPWIFQQVIRIDAASSGSSEPIITLSTQHIGNDLALLREFLHEQIHIPIRGPSLLEAMDKLRQRYPNAPTELPQGGPSADVTYLHLVVNWLELDAMTQLLGREKARQIASEVGHYTWIYDKVLEETQQIGAILAKNDLVITPEKGIIVKSKGN
jgi:hypothetical protein